MTRSLASRKSLELHSTGLKMGRMSETTSPIDAYFAELQRLAEMCLGRSVIPHEVIDQPPSDFRGAVERCLRFRSEFLAESEERTLSG